MTSENFEPNKNYCMYTMYDQGQKKLIGFVSSWLNKIHKEIGNRAVVFVLGSNEKIFKGLAWYHSSITLSNKYQEEKTNLISFNTIFTSCLRGFVYRRAQINLLFSHIIEREGTAQVIEFILPITATMYQKAWLCLYISYIIITLCFLFPWSKA